MSTVYKYANLNNDVFDSNYNDSNYNDSSYNVINDVFYTSSGNDQSWHVPNSTITPTITPTITINPNDTLSKRVEELEEKIKLLTKKIDILESIRNIDCEETDESSGRIIDI